MGWQMTQDSPKSISSIITHWSERDKKALSFPWRCLREYWMSIGVLTLASFSVLLPHKPICSRCRWEQHREKSGFEHDWTLRSHMHNGVCILTRHMHSTICTSGHISIRAHGSSTEFTIYLSCRNLSCLGQQDIAIGTTRPLINKPDPEWSRSLQELNKFIIHLLSNWKERASMPPQIQCISQGSTINRKPKRKWY